MHITATMFYLLHRPSRCEKRLRLYFQKVTAAELGPFEKLLTELGQRHEQKHLDSLANVVDLGEGPVGVRASRTRKELDRRAKVLYQPFLSKEIQLDGQSVHLTGSPDFMLPSGDGWLIRDAKLSRKIDKPEILAQLNFYAFLLEEITGAAPVALEAFLGNGENDTTDYVGAESFLEQLRDVVRIVGDHGRYEPVGFSKCNGCGFKDQCWPEAEERDDVSLLADVDQGLARQLHSLGCESIPQLVEQFDEASLEQLQRPWGERLQRVGSKAASILNHARAYLDEHHIVIGAPALPEGETFVVFDVEALPPQIDDLDRVFLWGLKIYGEQQSEFLYSCSFPGESDDEETWFQFLELVSSLFDQHGNLHFLHWAAYERARIDDYISRFGDRDGVAALLQEQLCDLLPITADSVCLPLPSRSLKQVERHVGFERQIPGSGDWAVAQYVQAMETNDELLAETLMGGILSYNEEDLDATWAVFSWLRDEIAPAAARGE